MEHAPLHGAGLRTARRPGARSLFFNRLLPASRGKDLPCKSLPRVLPRKRNMLQGEKLFCSRQYTSEETPCN
jgi:hypothetical protein